MLFGLTQKIKAAYIKHVANEKGEEFAKQKGPVMDWIKRNKTGIGMFFGILSGALAASPWAAKATPILSVVASFLIGAGILPSDTHAAQDQNK